MNQACGFLLLNEFSTFIYCCNKCQCEFESGPNLEIHFLSDHQDDKQNIVNDEIFVDSFSCDPTSIKIEQTTHDEWNEDPPIAECIIGNDSQSDFNNEDSTQVSNNRTGRPSAAYKQKVKDEILPSKRLIGSKVANERETTKRTNKRLPKKKNKDEMVTTKKKKVKPCVLYCEICPELNFDGKNVLIKHMKSNHIPPKERKRCEKCGVHPRNYENHMRTNHSEHPLYKCNFCDAKFKGKHNCVIHMRNHTGEKPWLCVICGMSFTSQAAERKHDLHVHKQLRKFQCTLCDRSFIKKSRLRDHINGVHTKERPHQCAICKKSFTSSSYLRKHKFTHFSATKQCRYCEKMFKLHDNRRIHEKGVHGAF